MRAYGVTHQGKVRKENQDGFRFDAPQGREILTAVLCDGMGGAQSGRLACTVAADTFMSHAANSIDERSSAADLRAIALEAVSYANQKVYGKSFSDVSCMGMGSTMVALLISGKRALIANVGDSRAYLLHRGTLRQITNDHSLVEDMIAHGQISREEARTHPKRNIITRAIGVEASVECDIFELKLAPDSRILLCSDGLTNLLSDQEIADILRVNPEPEAACTVLLEQALQRGAPDNVTVFLTQR